MINKKVRQQVTGACLLLSSSFFFVFFCFCFETGEMLVVRKDYGVVGAHSMFSRV